MEEKEQKLPLQMDQRSRQQDKALIRYQNKDMARQDSSSAPGLCDKFTDKVNLHSENYMGRRGEKEE